MQLIPGSRLGSYEIIAPLGAGGMGEVHLARDERLDRQVASPRAAGGCPGPRSRSRSRSARSGPIADLTGGQSSSGEYADKAVARIMQTTSFSYLLGYYPSNSNWDGRYRRITVRVNRPGLTVLFRHGYYGRDQVVPYDRQQFMTYSRIAATGDYGAEVHDIKVTLTAAADGEGASRAVIAEVRIDPASVMLKEVDGQHVGALDVTFFCGDAKENTIGELWKRIDLKLGEDNFRRISEGGIVYQVKIPVKGEPRYVKVVVYDYGKDRVGSAVVKLK